MRAGHREGMKSSRSHRRDSWQRLISQVTRTVAVAAVAASLALSVVAARTFAGKTAAAPQRTRTVTLVQQGDDGSVRRVRVKVSTPSPATTRTQSTSTQSQQPVAPPATTSAPPATVSGGS